MRGKYEKKKTSRSPLILCLILLAALLILTAILTVALKGCGKQDKPSPSGTAPTDPSTPEPTQPGQLIVTAPQETSFSTLDEAVTFSGTSDPSQSLTLNGVPVERDPSGNFSVQQPLSQGENAFTLTMGTQTVHYTVFRRVLTQSYFPCGDMTYCSEGTILLSVIAKQGSEVTASIQGSEVTLSVCADQLSSGAQERFVLYEGRYPLPVLPADTDLGTITYTVQADGITETLYSGKLLGKAQVPKLDSDPSVTPEGYLDVGSGLIVEIVSNWAETFDGRTVDNKSNPTRNYLPKGTVDYCDAELVHYTPDKQTFRVMRCGLRVTEGKNNPPMRQRDEVSIVYNGSLPDHNELGFAGLTQSGNSTILTLDTMWKAPFLFSMEPQQYTNPETRDFTVTDFTVEYLDITFCYATRFTGRVEIPENHPLFSSAQVTQNDADCTLRLYLKKAGGFYGWDAYYNDAGQLCFRFLNPAVVTPGDNPYGADLTGVTVMLDVGHGGADGGTVGKYTGKTYTEAERNLTLATMLKEELERTGATVVMNRSDDSSVTAEERTTYLQQIHPDLCIAVHHNSSTSSSITGLGVYYFTPIGAAAAEHIRRANYGVYSNVSLAWHYYFVARQSVCPVVLTENGYMSSGADMAQIADTERNREKAKAIAQGVADYFLSLQNDA